MSSKYIALTLGPITRVIGTAKSTRELWGASYFFSYLAKRLVGCFAPGKPDGRQFLLPFIEEKMFSGSKGVGSFPDRYIFNSKEGDFEYLSQHADSLLQEIACNMDIILNPPPGKQIVPVPVSPGRKELTPTQQKIYEYLRKSLKIYFFEKEYPEEMSRAAIVSDCEYYMNLMEMQDLFPVIEKKNYLQAYLERINGYPVIDEKGTRSGFSGSFLAWDAFPGKENQRFFPSLLEIAAPAREFRSYNYASYRLQYEKHTMEPVDQREAENTIREVENSLRPYEKYVAIIQADGDSLGNTILSLGSDGGQLKLSEALYNFNMEVVEKIRAFGAKPVFIGGDDLLILSPVYYQKGSVSHTVFDLVQEIDACFAKHMKVLGEPAGVSYPTLSFGVSISYYKYPFFEALEQAESLLKEKAKEPAYTGSCALKKAEKKKRIALKNNIAVSIRKHSGQIYEALIRKNYEGVADDFFVFVQKYKDQKECNSKFLSSVMYKLEGLRPLMKIVMDGKPEEVSKERLRNLFDNHFNDLLHQKQYKEILEDVRELLWKLFRSYQGQFEYINRLLRSEAYLKKEKEKERWDWMGEALAITVLTLQFIHSIRTRTNDK